MLLLASEDFSILREVIAHRIAVQHAEVAEQTYRTPNTILSTGGATEGILHTMREMAKWVTVKDALDQIQSEVNGEKPVLTGATIVHSNLG